MLAGNYFSRVVSAHLFPHEARLESLLRSFHEPLLIEATENIEQESNESGPPSLVTGAQPGAVVAMEVLVKEDMIAPMRIFLELGSAAVERPLSIGIAKENAG